MLFLPLAETIINPLHIFLISLMIGLLSGSMGKKADLLVVPALSIFGLPITFAIGTNIAQGFGRSSMALFNGAILKEGFPRVGFVAGIFGLPGVYMGRALLLQLVDTRFGNVFIIICYISLLLAAAFASYRQWLHFKEWGCVDKNPLPPFGMGWRYPLAAPGLVGKDFITVGRVVFVGLFLGFITGFLGPGAGVVGIPLFMYVLGFDATTAAATDLLTMLIIGAGALLGFALAGKTEVFAIIVVLTAIVIGIRAGSLLIAQLRFAHTHLAFTLALCAAAISMALWLLGMTHAATASFLGSCLLMCIIQTLLSFLPRHKNKVTPSGPSEGKTAI